MVNSWYGSGNSIGIFPFGKLQFFPFPLHKTCNSKTDPYEKVHSINIYWLKEKVRIQNFNYWKAIIGRDGLTQVLFISFLIETRRFNELCSKTGNLFFNTFFHLIFSITNYSAHFFSLSQFFVNRYLFNLSSVVS